MDHVSWKSDILKPYLFFGHRCVIGRYYGKDDFFYVLGGDGDLSDWWRVILVFENYIQNHPSAYIAYCCLKIVYWKKDWSLIINYSRMLHWVDFLKNVLRRIVWVFSQMNSFSLTN